MDTSNKRIFKNTGYLYVRQVFIMVLGFLTTRIVLDKLGASDYGVNNVVAGFVSMFTLLNSILQTGTRRFLALNMVKNDDPLLKLTFSTSFVIHLLVAIVVVVLLESFGVWFLNTYLNIPDGRMAAAQWIFQFSVISVFLNITQTPYTAAVTAHEQFNVYAALSIFDVVAKLLVLFLLVYISGDKLIIYGALIMLVNFINVCLVRGYCLKEYDECRFSLKIYKPLFREMAVFSGWSTVGHISSVLNSHGRSILLNMFFNTFVNAAVGLANTVTFTISQFVNGFIMAANPQLVKYYGEGNYERIYRLVFNVTQLTIFLLALIGVPVLLEIDYVLELWLTEVPQYTSEFIKITVIVSFIGYSNMFVDQAVVAIGRTKELSLYSQPLYLLTLPLIYLALKVGWSPTSIYFIGAFPSSLAFIVNLGILKKNINFPANKFFVHVFLKNVAFILIALIPPYIVQSQMSLGLVRFLVVCVVAVVSTVACMYFFAMDKGIRQMVRQKIWGRYIKKFRIQ